MVLPKINLPSLNKISTAWHELNLDQKFAIFFFVFILFLLPLSILLTLSPVQLLKRAFYPVTPPTTPPTYPTSYPTSIPTPTPTLPSACLGDKATINVAVYTRPDGYPGLKVSVSAYTPYTYVALKITQAGADGYLITNAPVVTQTNGRYQWTWTTVKPPVDAYKIEFYVNHTSQSNGYPCGVWYSKPTPTPTRPVFPTPTPTPPPPINACKDKGIISVSSYRRPDGYTGLKVSVTAKTPYVYVALKITQTGRDGYFISNGPVVTQFNGGYQWTWETVKPPVDSYKIEFYINHTPKENGQPCGEWYSKPTPTPSPSSLLTPTPTPVIIPIFRNNLPVIAVSPESLPGAQFFKWYAVEINGYDRDTKDKLTLTVRNLPPGLHLDPCTTSIKDNVQFIKCWIVGRPMSVGNFRPAVTLKDNRQGVAERSFYLRVSWPALFPRRFPFFGR